MIEFVLRFSVKDGSLNIKAQEVHSDGTVLTVIDSPLSLSELRSLEEISASAMEQFEVPIASCT